MSKGLLAGVGAALAAAVVAGVLILKPGEAPPPPVTPPAQQQAATPTTPPPAAPPATTTPAPAPAATPAAPPLPPSPIAYQRYEVETGADQPSLCLVFSSLLKREGVNYGPFITVSGRPLTFRVDGRRLCLSGMEYGKPYNVTLRQGLPGADGTTVAETSSFEVSLGDRKPSVAFGSGVILPAASLDGIPVTTVNVDKLALSVYRVTDRNLVRRWPGFLDDRSFYSWDVSEIAENEGRQVWTGSLPVKGERNAAAVSLVPVKEAMDPNRPGVYLVVAKPDDGKDGAGATASAGEGEEEDSGYGEPPAAGQWFIRTDIGLTAFRGADGLTMFARSLGGAKPLAGVELVLYARGNEELGRATTDSQGRAQFAAGLLRGTAGAEPTAVMAYGKDDFTYLDLRRGAFDLSDRGVDGREAAGAVDAFVYTERGIYRPGETVHLTALVRDAVGAALPGRAMVARLVRPDGREAKRWRLDDAGGGAVRVDMPISKVAQRGTWSASIHADPGGPAVGTVSFEVQDFVPQKLAVTLGQPPAFVRPGDELRLGVDVRFLYGAPGADLSGSAAMVIERDDDPFPAYPGFQWGKADERIDGAREEMTLDTTDPQGHTEAVGTVTVNNDYRRPLLATVEVSINEPGGRATSMETKVPVRPLPVFVGLRPAFAGGVPEGSEAAFEVIAVNDAGQRMARGGLKWQILREGGVWQWFRRGGSWDYEYIARDRMVSGGELAVDAAAPASLKSALDWGRYRLEVTDPATGAMVSTRFSVGYFGAADTRPDRLEVATGKGGYAPGDTATVHVDSDTGGEALLVIANEKIHDSRLVSIPAGGGDIAIPVKAEWGAGAYALVTLYRPLSGPNAAGRNPVRAVGVAWLGLDPAAHTIAVSLTPPQVMEPRQTLTIPVRLAGVTAAGTAHVTVAAVDEGILALTRYATPDPAKWYLSKRRLGVEMRDDYGRLIQGPPRDGQGQGGDSMGGPSLDVVPTITVALYSGVVPVAADGTAAVTFDVPDFQGELRVMAVAWDGARTGSAEARVTVRDPVVAEVILPRFLAPGDIAQATVLVHNVSGKPGDYTVTVSGKDAVAVADASGTRTVTLPEGKRETWTVPLTGPAAGIGTVQMAVKGPGFAVTHAWPIQVRPGALPITREQVSTLQPGQDLTLDGSLLAGFLPGTVKGAVSLSRWQQMDVPGLLRWLDRYPYGCLEQTTSRAMPLLYFNDLAALTGGKDDAGIEGRVQGAIDRLVTMQGYSGDFRMWGSWGDMADPWVSVFALDFLHRAAAKGYEVPDSTLRDGRRWLAYASSNEAPSVRAYAGWVLATQGQANISDLRYLHDTALPPHAVARAQLGAALEAAGDRARATDSFNKARAVLGQKTDGAPPYGSTLRDSYVIAAALASAGRGEEVPGILARVKGLRQGADWTTTQEKAWMLLTAAELARSGGALAVERDGQPVAGGKDPLLLPLDADRLATAPSRLRNTGTAPLFPVVSVEGVPDHPLPPEQKGVAVRKSYYSLDGLPVDPSALRRNDRVVMVIEGKAISGREDTYAVLDLLPAGLEIEAILSPDDSGFGWLSMVSSLNVQEKRDDRLVAAFPLPAWDREADLAPWIKGDPKLSFRVAAVLRAVTPGQFVLPGTRVEAMYAADVRGTTATGQITVSE